MKGTFPAVRCIVSEFRAPGCPVSKHAAPPQHGNPAPKKKFMPFPPGTVRGPYTCGTGAGPNTGVQFAVKEKDGGWRYFIKMRRGVGEAACRKEAEYYSRKLLEGAS